MSQSANLILRLLSNSGEEWHKLLVLGIVSSLEAVYIPLRSKLMTLTSSIKMTSRVPDARVRSKIVSHVASTILDRLQRIDNVKYDINSEDVKHRLALWSHTLAGQGAIDIAVATSSQLKYILKNHCAITHTGTSNATVTIADPTKAITKFHAEDLQDGEKWEVCGHADILATLARDA